jgi:hypothetical protein
MDGLPIEWSLHPRDKGCEILSNIKASEPVWLARIGIRGAWHKLQWGAFVSRHVIMFQ